MGLLSALWRRSRNASGRRTTPPRRFVRLEGPERLEDRTVPSVTANLSNGLLAVVGDGPRDHIEVSLNTAKTQIVVTDFGQEVGSFASADVSNIAITEGDGNNVVIIDPQVTQSAVIRAGNGNDSLHAGGGPTTIIAGDGNNKLYAGSGPDYLEGGSGTNSFFKVKPNDIVVSNPGDRIYDASLPAGQTDPPAAADQELTTSDVSTLLDRAAAATANDSAIVAVVDRNGNILGVRVEGGVSPDITGNIATLTFAIDGAVAEARTGAMFSSNQAPITSRTVQYISQTTITQQEVESSPDVLDPNSPLRGPGFVAPIGIAGHFPPDIPNTPQVDLFDIEGTNRDSLIQPGPDGVKGDPGTITLPNRFNVPTQYLGVPQSQFTAPESYGYVSGLFPDAQSRGIGTLPGGIPLYKNGQLVGGIGVFFPGTTGYADAENSSLSANYDPSKPDLSLEAEYIAFAAAGGSSGAGFSIGTLGGVPPIPGFDLPFGRIDLVGLTLPIYGPNGNQGPQSLVAFGHNLGTGNPNSGSNQLIGHNPDGSPIYLAAGTPVPSGWLVTPHAGSGLTAADVEQIVQQGIAQANLTRSAIRLPLGTRTKMTFAVSDENGNILGLYRMPDSPTFSIGVSVAKARNNAYYANPAQLQPEDQLAGVPAGTAFSSRTFRYLALPRFPESVEGAPPAPFSILNDGGSSLTTGLEVGPPLPPSAFQSVMGHDAFFPDTNFHDPYNPANQNGVVFFPGGVPLYTNGQLVGGLGVSGDGVDQDDVVTAASAVGFTPPTNVLTADDIVYHNIRLPYQKFNRNPEE
jgi:uncharacterized protein GlcG (DUF336 family)